MNLVNQPTIGVEFPKDDLVSFDANVVSKQLGGSIPRHHLFGGIKDCTPDPISTIHGKFDGIFSISSVDGYIGAWPEPGVIDRLPFGLGRGSPISTNMTRLIGGAYRYKSNRASILSFSPNILTNAASELSIKKGLKKASARLRIEHLQGTELERWTNETLLASAVAKSQRGARSLNSVGQQFRLPSEDAPSVFARLQGAKVNCALGGEYKLSSQVEGQRPRWRSSQHQATEIKSPVLDWFRGGVLSVRREQERLLMDARILIARKSILSGSSGDNVKNSKVRRRGVLVVAPAFPCIGLR